MATHIYPIGSSEDFWVLIAWQQLDPRLHADFADPEISSTFSLFSSCNKQIHKFPLLYDLSYPFLQLYIFSVIHGRYKDVLIRLFIYLYIINTNSEEGVNNSKYQ